MPTGLDRIGQNPRRLILGIVLTLAVLLAGAAGLLVWKFPFHRDAIVERIKSRTRTQVDIGAFHEKWFPPGFSAEQVRLSDAAGDVLAIDSITVEDGYWGLIRVPKTLGNIRAKGLRLLIPEKSNGQRRTLLRPDSGGGGTGLDVDRIRLDNAKLDIAPETPGKPPLEFAVGTLLLSNAGPHKRTKFEVSLLNPRPRGEIHSQGEFGPVDTEHGDRTPVSGAFTFSHADLTADRAITGILNASGRFQGPVGSLNCAGTADVPRFQVVGSIHPVHVAANFEATVNALNGNADLKRIVAHYDNTTVLAAGQVAGEPGRKGKILTLNTNVRDGRVGDLLALFTNRNLPAMEGPITLQAKFTLPPGPPDFLTRLKVDGEFAISQAHFTNPQAQTPVNRLSASAEGESKQHERANPTLATADVHARVTARDGVARLPDIRFDAPGVSGRLAGSFGLHDKAINMSGSFDTTGKLADTTSGFKTLLLKAAGRSGTNRRQ